MFTSGELSIFITSSCKERKHFRMADDASFFQNVGNFTCSGVDYEVKDFSLFNQPGWLLDGVEYIKEVVSIALEREFFTRKMELLDRARKKTTQKVNLYEKVQIPGFQEAIRKIKRFLEDEENLSKSSQKIVKTRKLMEE